MPRQEFTLYAAVSRLENGCLLGRAVWFPEISVCGTDAFRVCLELGSLARAVVEGEPPWRIHRRYPAGVPEVRTINVEEPRPGKQPGWLGPVPLSFQALAWRHGDEAVVGWVPELDIEVIAEDFANLDRRLPDEVRAALLRIRLSRDHAPGPWLQKLLWLQRRQETTIQAEQVAFDLLSPREIAEARRNVTPPDVLPVVADPLVRGRLEPAFEVESLVAAVAEHVLNDRPRSVLLVGPPGVGKTAVFRQFVRELPGAARPCWATSGARLVAGMSGFGAWQQRCQALVAEAARSAALVHLGDVIELLEVGRSHAAGESVGDFLHPAIGRGELVAILEATPEQARVLERDHPRVSSALVRIDVPEPDADAARRILRRVAAGRADDDVLDLIDRLHRRFATYSAHPGRPLGFLRRLIDDPRPHGKPRSTDVTRAFSRETGLPLLFLEEGLSLDLEATRDWVGQRVMGQPRAVHLVVDLLATIKAGLARPGRPIASLLLIGPTGVGKTQMSKALAEFLYRSPDRMTRIDMSEYADPLAVERLVGGLGGEGMLTAKVREQPFGVLLLDEFEKAHPRIFDLLLQVLGEGRLTDAAGRTADFRNMVVVMTSNLGSESFGARPAGFGGESGDADRHFTDAVRRFLRPELFNRIDRIVPFLPLAEETVRRIAARELDLVRSRAGIRGRGVELVIRPGVAATVARHGFDPRHGARPIKRAVDRLLLAPLAAALNQQGGGPSQAVVSVAADAAVVDVAVHRDANPGRSSASPAGLVSLAGWCRRNGEAVGDSFPMQRIRNELFLARRLRPNLADQAALPGGGRMTKDEVEARRREERLADAVGRVDAWIARSRELELRTLRGYHGIGAGDAAVADELLEHSRSLRGLLEALYAEHGPAAKAVTVGLFGETLREMRRLARAYLGIAASRGFSLDLHAVRVGRPPKGGNTADVAAVPLAEQPADAARREARTRAGLVAHRVPSPEGFLAPQGDGPAESGEQPVVGLLLCGQWFPAAALFAGEAGMHLWHGAGPTTDRCRVDVQPVPFTAYAAPAGVDRPGGNAGVPTCREYRIEKREATDSPTKRRLVWRDTPADDARVCRIFAEHRLLVTIMEWLDE